MFRERAHAPRAPASDARPAGSYTHRVRVITANLNGIRSAASKGFFAWLSRQRADVVCLQETKAQLHQLGDPVFHPARFHCHYHDAEKKGYSGTALYARTRPRAFVSGLGVDWIDREGRWLEAHFGNLIAVSLYLPSGSAGDLRQDYKYRVMAALMPRLRTLRDDGRHVIVCGDWNIAPTEADIRNWRGNRKSSGFLPEERAWIARLCDEEGYRDAFRQLPQREHEYTWWSQRGQARAKNVGWRIDHHIATAPLAERVTRTRVHRTRMFSDHAPLIIDYALDIEP